MTRDEFEDISTGDEIHLTSGEIWSCVASYCGSIITGVSFVKGSFAEARENGGEFDPRETLNCQLVKEIFWDAVQGGAKVVKGIGLSNDDSPS